MVSAVGHISGGHFNPAITLGFLITRRLAPMLALVYWILQFAAAAAAAAAAALVLRRGDADTAHLGAPALAANISTWQGVVIEGVLTFFLVWVVFATAADPGGTFKSIAGLAIGLTITLDMLMGGPLTGAAMNPARAFGPELVQHDWDDAWVWYLGPFAGGALAALCLRVALPASGAATPPVGPPETGVIEPRPGDDRRLAAASEPQFVLERARVTAPRLAVGTTLSPRSRPSSTRSWTTSSGGRLSEFTAARNELAKRLRKAGQDDAAERVQALKKPSVPVWAANQLARRHPDEVQALVGRRRRAAAGAGGGLPRRRGPGSACVTRPRPSASRADARPQRARAARRGGQRPVTRGRRPTASASLLRGGRDRPRRPELLAAGAAGRGGRADGVRRRSRGMKSRRRRRKRGRQRTTAAAARARAERRRRKERTSQARASVREARGRSRPTPSARRERIEADADRERRKASRPSCGRGRAQSRARGRARPSDLRTARAARATRR